MNVLLWLSYQGTRYAGFQVQPNAPTVCETLQDAMQAVLGCRPDVKGCSRTDAGVHARRFALSFHYTGHVPESFHARYAAHAKTYTYRIRNAAVDDPFDFPYTHRIAAPLDTAAMQRAAAGFIGTHDCLALCAAGSSVAARGDTVRTITRCEVTRAGEIVTITVTADGYLYNMVRILAGTIVEAGLGKLDPEEVPEILSGRDRRRAGPTLPAKGLCLVGVEYGEECKIKTEK